MSVSSPEIPALCPQGHSLRLTHLPDIRKRLCAECREYIPRSAPRHACRWCTYNVCYSCATQFSYRQWKEGGQKTVAISKFYDIVAPQDSEMRQHCHSRKGFAISEDCRLPEFSDAGLRLVKGQCANPSQEPSSFSSTACRVASDVVRRGMQLLDILSDEIQAHVDCMDKDWRPELPQLPEETRRQVQPGSILSWLLGGGDEAGKIMALCEAAQGVLKTQPVVSEVPAPAKVFGDIHGQLRDLLLLFHFYGSPGPNQGQAQAQASSQAAPLTRVPSNPRSLFAASSSSSSAAVLRRTSSSLERALTRTRSLKSFRSPENAQLSFVFNGDWVDRGLHQLEVVVLLLALKVMYPGQVYLNRGNHEDRGQNLKTSMRGGLGFDRACLLHFPGQVARDVFEAIHNTFDWLPLAARVGGRIFVLHGGLGNGDWTLDMLRAVPRPCRLNDTSSDVGNMVYNTLWSDPLTPDRKNPLETFGVHASHRAKHSMLMKTFGRDITERFCKREGIDLIIRSHQFKQSGKGYELMHDGLLLRVFSARNYCGISANDGGIVLIGYADGARDTLLVRAQNIERMLPTNRLERAMSRSTLNEPYCPNHHLMRLVELRPPPGCFSLSSLFQREMANVECNLCGREELELGSYFSCRACRSFDLCLDCVGQQAGRCASPEALVAGVATEEVLQAAAAAAPLSSPKEKQRALQEPAAGHQSPSGGPTLLTTRAAAFEAAASKSPSVSAGPREAVRPPVHEV